MNMLKIHLMYSFGPTAESSLSDCGWFTPTDIFAQEDSVGVARINYQHNLMLVLCVRIGAVDLGCDILSCDFGLTNSHMPHLGSREGFLISDVEMVQVLYDKAGGVSALSITYSAEHTNPPTPLAILGEDVTADADGRIYKLIRYPESDYWVAYSRTAGAAPVVSVTINKM